MSIPIPSEFEHYIITCEAEAINRFVRYLVTFLQEISNLTLQSQKISRSLQRVLKHVAHGKFD
jgi:hypothetical protein